MITTIADGRHEEDPRQVLASLAATACPWHRVFDGLEVTYTTRMTWFDGSTPPQTESCVYGQAGPRLWRLDVTLFDGLRVNTCGYDNLCYGVFDGHFLEMGADGALRASIEANLWARNPLISEAAAILDEPIAEVLRLPGFTFEVLEEPRHEGSTGRAVWRLEETNDGIPPATGVIEWRDEKVGALVTHLEWRFLAAEGTPVIVIDVEYRAWGGRLLPWRAVRNNGAAIGETILENVAPAVTDREHYAPQAFGLEMPS